MNNPYQPIIDVLRLANTLLQYNAPRSKAKEAIDRAMNLSVSYLWIETELYTIKEMLDVETIPTADIVVAIVELINELRNI